MAINAHWWKFSHRMIEFERDAPGVYELGDKDHAVIYIGSSSHLRQRLLEHFNDPDHSCLKQDAVHFRVEYCVDCAKREREVYQQHLAAFGQPPRFNSAADNEPHAPGSES